MRSKRNNKNAIHAMKKKETQVIRSFHHSAVDVLRDRYFSLISKTLPDPPFLNNYFDVPPIRINELIYWQPENRLINLMEDATNYACSRIIPIMNARSVLTDTDSDSDSAHSPLLDDDDFSILKELSHEILEEYCQILPFCMPFNSHLHTRHEDSNVKGSSRKIFWVKIR